MKVGWSVYWFATFLLVSSSVLCFAAKINMGPMCKWCLKAEHREERTLALLTQERIKQREERGWLLDVSHRTCTLMVDVCSRLRHRQGFRRSLVSQGAPSDSRSLRRLTSSQDIQSLWIQIKSSTIYFFLQACLIASVGPASFETKAAVERVYSVGSGSEDQPCPWI